MSIFNSVILYTKTSSKKFFFLSSPKQGNKLCGMGEGEIKFLQYKIDAWWERVKYSI